MDTACRPVLPVENEAAALARRVVGAGDPLWRASYMEALREGFVCGGESPMGADELAAAEADPDAHFVQMLAQSGFVDTPYGRVERVPGPKLWAVDGTDFVGMASIRPRMANPFLADFGGHIGYGVRPSRRRQGFAKMLLRASLTVCAALGVGAVFVSAKDWNTASRRTIESCGGRLVDVVPYPFGREGERMARYLFD
jgi:predicted acetyltransferase